MFFALGPKQVGIAFLAIIRQGKERGKGKNSRAQCQDIAAIGHSGIKGLQGNRHPLFGGCKPGVGNEDSQGGKGTNQQGIDSRADHGHQSLTHRFIGFGRAMRHRGRTDARLVGESRPLGANQDNRTYRTAHYSITGKGIGKYQTEHSRYMLDVQKDYHQHGDKINDYHYRHQLAGYRADTPDTPEDDGSHQGSKHQTGEQIGNTKTQPLRMVIGITQTKWRQHYIMDNLGKLIGLENGQHPYHTGHTKQDCQPVPGMVQPFAYYIHRATLQLAAGVFAAVHNSQATGKILGSHTEKGADPHPEDGPRAAHQNSYCYATDIAHTHGCRQMGGKRLVVVDLTLFFGVVIPPQQDIDGMTEVLELNKTRIKEKVNTATQQQNQQGCPPHGIAKPDHGTFQRFTYIHRLFVYWSKKPKI